MGPKQQTLWGRAVRAPTINRNYAGWKRKEAEAQFVLRGLDFGPPSGPDYLTLSALRRIATDFDNNQQPAAPAPAAVQPAALTPVPQPTAPAAAAVQPAAVPPPALTPVPQPTAPAAAAAAVTPTTGKRSSSRARSQGTKRARVEAPPLTDIVWDDGDDFGGTEPEARIPVVIDIVSDEEEGGEDASPKLKVMGVNVATLERHKSTWPWLKWADGRVFCANCAYVFTNATQFKRDFGRHAQEEGHLSSGSLATLMAKNAEETARQSRENMTTLVKTIFHCVKIGIPVSKLLKHLSFFVDELQCKRMREWLAGDVHYFSAQSITEWMKAIGETLLSGIAADAVTSGRVGLIADSTKDVARKEQCVIVLRFVHDSEPQERLVDMSEIRDRSAQGYSTHIRKIVDKLGLRFHDAAEVSDNPNVWFDGVALDGAANMLGKHAGLAKQLRYWWGPSAIEMWCHCHLLNLACGDAAKEVPSVDRFLNLLRSVWVFLYTHNKHHEGFREMLRELSDVINQDELAAPTETRWLTQGNAVHTLNSQLPVLIAYLKKVEHLGPTEQSLLKQLSDRSFFGMVAMLDTMLGLLNGLSMDLQAKDLNILETCAYIQSTIAKFRMLQDTASAYGAYHTFPGRYQDVFPHQQVNKTNTLALFHETVGAPYCGAVIKTLEQRFSNNKEIAQFAVFDVRNWTADQAYGEEQISAIEKRYCSGTHIHFKQFNKIDNTSYPQYSSTEYTERARTGRAVLDGGQGALALEWRCLRIVLRERKLPQHSRSLLKFLQSAEGAPFPLLRKVSLLVSTLPSTSVEAERRFSLLKIIKTRLKSHMTDDSLLYICLIKQHRDTLSDGEIEEILRRFTAVRNRKVQL